MQLIVQAEGVAPRAVEFEGLVHRRRRPTPARSRVAAPAPEPDDQLAKLERLGALRASGVLPEDKHRR